MGKYYENLFSIEKFQKWGFNYHEGKLFPTVLPFDIFYCMSASCRGIPWTNSTLKRIGAPIGKSATTHSPAIHNLTAVLPVIYVATHILKLLLLISSICHVL